jgi:hypothetical protein
MTSCLQYYYATLAMMMPTESKLLKSWLTKLQKVLDPGFADLTWNALGIPDFVKNCTTAINDLRSLISQVC